MNRLNGVACLAVLAGLLLSAGSAPLQADEGLSRLEAHKLIADALYLESGMGEYERAAAIYSEVLKNSGALGPEVQAEAAHRRAMAFEALGRAEEAERAYLLLLDRFDSTSWSVEARSRLQALQQARKTVRSLPIDYDFEAGLAGLFHSPTRSTKGRLEQQSAPAGSAGGGVAVWRTRVVASEDDLLLLAFDGRLKVRGEVSLRVRSERFPAHLSFVLEDEAGQRFASKSLRVRPQDGWTELTIRAPQFRSAGEEERRGAYRARDGMAYLIIRDLTGFSSTDRGENRLLLDDLKVR
ncbi:MAG: hypothetical protein VX498_08910 [Myxococcota bacterium]|nr:hypothetical protein [Myxococcota bacterium]